MSASFASVIPTCTLLTAEEGCSSDNTCKTCGDVADITFASDRFYPGTDVAGEAFTHFDATTDDAGDGGPSDAATDAATDAPDGD